MERQLATLGGPREARRIADSTIFVPGIANASVLETADGLVLVDAGFEADGRHIHAAVRALTTTALHTVVFTHGHLDHAFGLAPWLAEQDAPRPRVVAHRNVPARFRRYMRTPGLNEHINLIQFGTAHSVYRPGAGWPSRPEEFFWPDTLYDDRLALRVGGEVFELHHAKGETDDATWVWAPERKILLTGDLWISVAPNAGNPYKVQRYPEEWADAAEQMAGLGAELLLPGHGPPIEGREAIRDALSDLAAYLRSIVEQTLDGLNSGRTHEEIVAAVRVPDELAKKQYLLAFYDRPQFIARNVIRRYGGWWDGHPANLLPAPSADRAREIVALAGGVEALVARATELMQSDLPLACHLAEWAAAGAPDDPVALRCQRDVFRARLDRERSLMARGAFMWAVTKAEAKLAELGES